MVVNVFSRSCRSSLFSLPLLFTSLNLELLSLRSLCLKSLCCGKLLFFLYLFFPISTSAPQCPQSLYLK